LSGARGRRGTAAPASHRPTLCGHRAVRRLALVLANRRARPGARERPACVGDRGTQDECNRRARLRSNSGVSSGPREAPAFSAEQQRGHLLASAPRRKRRAPSGSCFVVNRGVSGIEHMTPPDPRRSACRRRDGATPIDPSLPPLL
jgi:hypothetical protein